MKTNTKMKTETHTKTAGGKARREMIRKRQASGLDPFTEPLLAMDDATKTIQEMVAWLKTQGVETSASNVSAFLISRRQRRELRAQLHLEKELGETVEEWFVAEGGPKLETLMGLFKVLVLKLATGKDLDPQLLKLADRLARTAIGYAHDQERAAYRERKLVMEEAKHAEWVKCEQTRALELSLDESKKYPAVADMFRAAFAALREAMEEAKRPKAPRARETSNTEIRNGNAGAAEVEDEDEDEDEKDESGRVEGDQAEARRGKEACGRRAAGNAARAGESTEFQAPSANEDSSAELQDEDGTVPETEEEEEEDEEEEESEPGGLSEIDPMENATWRAQRGY